MVVETDGGEEREVVLKTSVPIELGVEGLANELLGALLAGDLGLPVNEPFVVPLDAAFIDSITQPPLAKRLRESNPIAFASATAGPQWRRWQSINKVATDQRALALAILAFDAFTANSDRSPRNPNLLVHGTDWRLIDHEAAFSFRTKLFPRCKPWELGNLGLLINRGADSEHLFAFHLKGKRGLNLENVRAAWVDLPDARLLAYEAAFPDEWVEAMPAVHAAIAHIKDVRDRIDACLGEVMRVLS